MEAELDLFPYDWSNHPYLNQTKVIFETSILACLPLLIDQFVRCKQLISPLLIWVRSF